MLSFDEINKFDKRYIELRENLMAMTPSEVMDRKEEICDWITDLLMYVYVYGAEQALQDLGYDLTALAVGEDELQEALNKTYDGLNYRERVMQHAELGDTQKILLVADTDGHRLYNAGGYDTAKDKATAKVWNTMLDDRVRDSHDYLEGMSVGIDEAFYTYNGDSAMYPGQFESPEENCNCRCYITYE